MRLTSATCAKVTTYLATNRGCRVHWAESKISTGSNTWNASNTSL